MEATLERKMRLLVDLGYCRAVPFTGSWEGIRDAVDRPPAGRAHGAVQPPKRTRE